jgi:hypothetical protein
MDLKNAALFALPALISKRKLRCWFLTMFHGLELRCCHCGAPLEGKARNSFLNFRITSCANCKLKVYFFRDTPFHAAKISQEEFVLLAAMLALNVPVKDVAAALSLAEATVRDWAGKLEALNEPTRKADDATTDHN